jgi:hypothetical protein
MTILQRRQLREEILARELERAHARARRTWLTGACWSAMEATRSNSARARGLHGACGGEELHGDGCLCLCHDVIGEGVESGQAT